MVQSNDAVTPLRSELAIWRYMDVARFLALIHGRKLYFARLRELRDPWEGVWTASASDGSRHAEPGNIPEVVQEFNRFALISCWHENEQESVAMWKLYVSGSEGIAIKTTVGSLSRALGANPVSEPKIGRVRYEDDTCDPQPDPYQGYAECFLFRKRKGYLHEQEIRAVIYDPCNSDGATFAEASLVVNGLAPRRQLDRGEAVAVDLSILVERIVVSPGFPTWAIDWLQTVVDASGINVKIEPSSLFDGPHNDLLGTQR